LVSRDVTSLASDFRRCRRKIILGIPEIVEGLVYLIKTPDSSGIPVLFVMPE
jgi:hypothetical protein